MFLYKILYVFVPPLKIFEVQCVYNRRLCDVEVHLTILTLQHPVFRVNELKKTDARSVRAQKPTSSDIFFISLSSANVLHRESCWTDCSAYLK